MWFKQSTQPSEIETTQSYLTSLLSNGYQLSIEELLPYQNKVSLINLKATKNLHNRLSGNYLSRSKGRGMEFDEVRHYQTGDDIRAIDWRVTARTGKTHTKLFREEIERPVLIATDLSNTMKFGSQLLFKSVQAAHIAALVAWHGKSKGDRIGGIVFNDSKHYELKPRSRKAGVLHYLHALTQIHANHNLKNDSKQDSTPDSNESALTQQPTHVFEENCARLRQLARPGSLVYLITDALQLTQEALRHLTYISQHCELVVCLVSDPLEQQLPDSKTPLNVVLTDGMKRQQLTLGHADTTKAYQQQALALATKHKSLLNKAGARVMHYSAALPLESQLMSQAETSSPLEVSLESSFETSPETQLNNGATA